MGSKSRTNGANLAQGGEEGVPENQRNYEKKKQQQRKSKTKTKEGNTFVLKCGANVSKIRGLNGCAFTEVLYLQM